MPHGFQLSRSNERRINPIKTVKVSNARLKPEAVPLTSTSTGEQWTVTNFNDVNKIDTEALHCRRPS